MTTRITPAEQAILDQEIAGASARLDEWVERARAHRRDQSDCQIPRCPGGPTIVEMVFALREDEVEMVRTFAVAVHDLAEARDRIAELEAGR